MNSKSVKEGGIKSMYSKSKRFIASFLAVLMAVCMLPADVLGGVGVVHAAAPKPESVTITPGTGTVNNEVEVTLECDTNDAEIHYTTNGEEPTAASAVYDSANKPKLTPDAATKTATIMAVAVAKDDSDNSTTLGDVADATYTFKAAKPQSSLAEGNVSATDTITLQSATEGNTILYSLEGSEPTETYNGPISLTGKTGTINLVAKATKENYQDSDVLEVNYEVGTGEYTTVPEAVTTGAANKDGVYVFPYDENGASVTLKLPETADTTDKIYYIIKSTANAEDYKDITSDELADAAYAYTAGTSIPVNGLTEVKAVSTSENGDKKGAQPAEFKFNIQTKTPALKTGSAASGEVAADTEIEVESETGAAFKYKLNDAAAYTDSADGKITISAAGTYTVIAIAGTKAESEPLELTYTISGSVTPPSGVKNEFTLKVDFSSLATTATSYDDGYFNVKSNMLIKDNKTITVPAGNKIGWEASTSRVSHNGYEMGKSNTSSNANRLIVFTPTSNGTVTVGASTGSTGRKVGYQIVADSEGVKPAKADLDGDGGLEVGQNALTEYTFSVTKGTTYAIANTNTIVIHYVFVEEADYIPQPPVPSKEAGAVDNGTEITFSVPEGVDVYVKEGTDAPDTTDASQKYDNSNPITITANKTITVVAKAGEKTSMAKTYTYTVASPKTANPVVTYDETAKTVTMACADADADAEIYYTLNGKDPVANGIKYEGTAISLEKTQTIRAYAKKDNQRNSDVVYKTCIVKTSEKNKKYVLNSNTEEEFDTTALPQGYTEGDVWAIGTDGYFKPLYANIVDGSSKKASISPMSQLTQAVLNTTNSYDISAITNWPTELGTLSNDTKVLTLLGGKVDKADNGKVANAVRIDVGSTSDAKVVVYYSAKEPSTSTKDMRIAVYEASDDDTVIGTAKTISTDGGNNPSTNNTKVGKAEFMLPAGSYYVGFSNSGGIIPYMEVIENYDANNEDTVTLTFMSDGTKVGDKEVTKGTTPYTLSDAEITAPTKTGYVFKGWAKTDGATADDVVTTVVPDDNITLYAVWEAEVASVTNPTFKPEAKNDGDTEYTFDTKTGTVTIEAGKTDTIYYVTDKANQTVYDSLDATDADLKAILAKDEYLYDKEAGIPIAASADNADGSTNIRAIAVGADGDVSGLVTSITYKIDPNGYETLDAEPKAELDPAGDVTAGDTVKVKLSVENDNDVDFRYTMGITEDIDDPELPGTGAKGEDYVKTGDGIELPTTAPAIVYVKVLAYKATDGTVTHKADLVKTFEFIVNDLAAPTAKIDGNAISATAAATVGDSVTFDVPTGMTVRYAEGASADAPTANTGEEYTAPIPLDAAGTVVIKAVTVNGTYVSEPAVFTITVTAPNVEAPDAPTATVDGNAVRDGDSIPVKADKAKVVLTADEGDIYYTTDGTTTPTSASTKYEAGATGVEIPVTAAAATTIKAVAIKDGVSSTVLTFELRKPYTFKVRLFKANGITPAKENAETDVTEGENYTFPATAPVLEPADDTKRFAGWQDASDANAELKALGSTYEGVNEDLSFKEVWKDKTDEKYTVKFLNAYDEEIVFKDKNKYKDLAAGTVIDIPAKSSERTGYKFNGWYIEGNYSKLYKEGDKYPVESNVTFVEDWDPIRYADEGMYVRITWEPTYTGKAVTPSLSVYYNGEYVDRSDYTAKYKNNTKAGTATVTVTGKNNWKGAKSGAVNFTVRRRDISSSYVKAPDEMTVVKGTKVSPFIIYNGKALKLNKDFTLSDGENSPGKLDSKGKYTDATAKETTKKDENGKDVTEPAKPNKLKVTGIGNFTGEIEIDVTVIEKSEALKIAVDTNALKKVVVGDERLDYDKLFGLEEDTDDQGNIKKDESGNTVYKKSIIKVTNKKTKAGLKCGIDYTVVENSGSLDSAGTYKFTVVGMGLYSGNVTKSFKINPQKLDKANIVAGVRDYTKPWDGKTAPPLVASPSAEYSPSGAWLEDLCVWQKVTKKDSEGKEYTEYEEMYDYKVTYSGNKKVGNAKAKITFINDYKGTPAPQPVTFTVKPAVVYSEEIEVRVPDMIFKKEGKSYKSKPVVYYWSDSAWDDGSIYTPLKASDYSLKYEYASASKYIEGTKTGEDKTTYTDGDKVAFEGTDKYAVVRVTVTLNGKKYTNTYKDDDDKDVTDPIYGYYRVFKPDGAVANLSKAKVKFYSDAGCTTELKKGIDFSGKTVFTPELDKDGNYKEVTKGELEYKQPVYVQVLYKNAPVKKTLYNVEWLNNCDQGKAIVIITAKEPAVTTPSTPDTPATAAEGDDNKGENTTATTTEFAVGSKNATLKINPIKRWVQAEEVKDAARKVLETLKGIF